MPPPAPATTNVAAPAGAVAELETVSVDDPEAAIDAGLNEAATPAGNPVTPSDTVPLNPFIAVTETAYVMLPPTDTVCEAGDTATAKSGVGVLTLNVTTTLWLRLPLWAVMERLEFPALVELGVEIVRVDEPDVLIADGLNLAVAPVGKPATLRVIVPVNPFCAAMLTV